MNNDSSSSTATSSGKGKLGCTVAAGIALLTLLPLWFFFLGPMMRHDELVEEGVHVPGRLLSVDETGTVVNDSPELELVIEFTRSDGTLDTATCDFVPTLRTLHFYQAGTAVTAAYDPDDPEEITVVSLGGPAPTHPGMQQTTTGLDIDSLKRVADSLAEELRKRRE